jgi:S1-C subfamily serine protease
MMRGIASLSGAADDPRYFQISVPVQPGNSGGALVDGQPFVPWRACAVAGTDGGVINGIIICWTAISV